MRWLALALVAACCPKPVVKPDSPAKVIVAPCLSKAPPSRKVIAAAAPCPDGWVCLDASQAGELNGQLRALRDYADEAWAACGAR